MSRYAYEDAVNEEFIKQVGQILANALDGSTGWADYNPHDYIQQLADLYESTIDALPDPTSEDEDDE